jgi:hypothetical protein
LWRRVNHAARDATETRRSSRQDEEFKFSKANKPRYGLPLATLTSAAATAWLAASKKLQNMHTQNPFARHIFELSVSRLILRTKFSKKSPL